MTLLGLVRRFPVRVSVTTGLVLVEALIELLFPLFIGLAINDLLDDRYRGLMALGGLGIAALVIGSARRFVDTRAYAGMYEIIAAEMVERERARGAETSRIAARTTLLGEFVEFLEDSMPQIISAIIGTVGILLIIGGLNTNVLFACLAMLVLLLVTYWATAARNFNLNRGYNDELERQIEAIDSRDGPTIGRHFSLLMRWNRRLSDLETVNYFVIWLGVIALLVYAPIEVIEPGETEYGFAFATILYVFQYVDALAALPLFIQQVIRLREIAGRLGAEDVDVPTGAD
ncbi:MAG: ABC transporter six-transmembrane domain-containing protein [Actinomycetota bacterium]